MKRSGRADLVLTDKPVYRYQALADGVDGEEKTFESDGAEQGWTLRRNKAWSRDFIAIQSQPCFGYRPDVSLSARDHDALRAGGFELKPFRQRSWHHAKRSTSVHKKLNVFNAPRRTGQMTLYVEQSHIKSPLKNMAIVAQPTNNATTLISLRKATRPLELPVEQATKFGLIVDFTTAKQIGLTIPANVLASADRVDQMTEVGSQKSELSEQERNADGR